jgi:hypothetical protein
MDSMHFGHERTSFFGVSRCLPPTPYFNGEKNIFSEWMYYALKQNDGQSQLPITLPRIKNK